MKTRFNLKAMFSLFLIAPFLVLIVMIFIFLGLSEMANTSSGLFEAPRHLIQPIRSIIENNYQSSTLAETGVLMLVDKEGQVLYAVSEMGYYSDIDDLNFMFSDLINSDLDNISILKYTYKDEPGFCFFDNSYVPAVFNQKIRVGISLFIIIISLMGLFFGQITTVVINNSIKKLVDASGFIADGNLDEKISLKYNNELVHIADAMNHMRVELREKRNVEQRFFMSVTHDLKTPLTSINGYLEALADDVIIDPREIKETILLMQKKTSLLDTRINELLDYSKNRTAGWRDQWSPIPILSWLEDLSSMFASDAELCGRQYDKNISIESNAIFKGNEKLLTRALENLFDNACRYTEKGDAIIFAAAHIIKGDFKVLKISLEDSGSGIELEDRDRIFELFYRNDRGRNSRGMGIGLASVKTIVEDHNGTVNCGNSLSGGTVFSITLPL